MFRRVVSSTAAAAGFVAIAAMAALYASQEAEPRVVEVVARRFAFEPSLVTVGVGERVRLVVTSADGVHGLEIKQFKVKKEVPRGGQPVVIEFTASEPGEFPVLCSEYCGNGHGEMKGVLIVQGADQ
jgi:cytochrome c oxidase subunit 2